MDSFNPTTKTQQAISAAVQAASLAGNPDVGPSHLLGALLAQGEGIATRALAMLLDRARAAGRFPVIHAFPGASNKPSNALCARARFELMGSEEVAYKGEPFMCNRWTLRL